MSDDDIIQAPPNVPRGDRLDTDYSPSSERDVEDLQQDQAGSPALDDPGIDRRDVQLLPGTGAPDDTGQTDVDPDELHIPRHPDADGVGPVEEQAATDGGQR
ncbi:MAG TPA: hypothetical protein VFH64_08760 [Amnibacterium sp.]|nr:hypothetical protein [Amnibacterium sp.]